MPVDPYKTLGVSRSASDAEVRRAYRRLVQLHHPDHNHGSPESEQRFEEVQDAYARIVEERKRVQRPGPKPPPAGPEVDSRLADIEAQVRKAAADARERARRAARQATASTDARRASDEELGYVTTDDSLSKILADAREEISGWFGSAREQPATKRVADMLDELAAKLRGEQP